MKQNQNCDIVELGDSPSGLLMVGYWHRCITHDLMYTSGQIKENICPDRIAMNCFDGIHNKDINGQCTICKKAV